MILARATEIFCEEMRKAMDTVVAMHRMIDEMDERALEVLAVFFRDR